MSDYSQASETDLVPDEQTPPRDGDGEIAVTETVPEDVRQLNAKLREKEELVAALTARLEQAAEKLDRLHRTGKDRGLRTGGGFPPELVEEQKNLVDNLQRAVEQWENMQTATVLGRLEIQIADLRDLVAGQVLDGGGRTESVRGAQTMPVDDSGRTTEREPPSTETTPDGSQLSSYEAMKASLFAVGESEPETPSASEGTAPREPADDLSAIAMDAVLSEVAPESPPQPIDVEQADSEAIRTAIDDRDAYIAYLIRKLRVAESGLLAPPDWEALNETPEELRETLEELQERFQQALRIAEVENSLERARLGREEARLNQMEEQIQKARKRLGLTDDEESSHEADPSDDGGEDGASAGRWMRMLGRHRDA